MSNYKLVNAEQLDTDLGSIADKIREKAQLSDSLLFPSGFIEGIDQCSSLNFTVAGGTVQPADPLENTIWVNTNVEISSWIFSPTEPENPAEGMVWFLIGTESNVELNALKKNGIQVCPLSAKQHISGTWVDRNAEIYQNGAWKEFISEFIIYDSGLFGENSNGVMFSADCVDDGENVTSISKNTAYMEWKSVGDATYALFYIEPKISCDGFSTLNISVANASAFVDEEGIRWGLARSIHAADPDFIAYEQIDNLSESETISVDVSNAGSSSYYAALRVSTPNATGFNVHVTKIWME